MKKVITKRLKDDVINVELVADHRYYGVIVEDDIKGFITKTDFYTGQYEVHSLEGLTEGNGWNDVESCKDLVKFIRKCVDFGYDVYEFETYQKLIQWLLEEDN